MALRNPVAVITSSRPNSAKVLEAQAIPAALQARISNQVPAWRAERLVGCTMTRNRSTSFPGSKADIEIMSPSGSVVVRGREFDDGRSFFWDA